MKGSYVSARIVTTAPIEANGLHFKLNSMGIEPHGPLLASSNNCISSWLRSFLNQDHFSFPMAPAIAQIKDDLAAVARMETMALTVSPKNVCGVACSSDTQSTSTKATTWVALKPIAQSFASHQPTTISRRQGFYASSRMRWWLMCCLRLMLSRKRSLGALLCVDHERDSQHPRPVGLVVVEEAAYYGSSYSFSSQTRVNVIGVLRVDSKCAICEAFLSQLASMKETQRKYKEDRLKEHRGREGTQKSAKHSRCFLYGGCGTAGVYPC